VPESGQDRSEALAGLGEDVGELGSKMDEPARHDAERAAERAETVQAAIDEPSVREQPVLAAGPRSGAVRA
jgi:hypothetical protein